MSTHSKTKEIGTFEPQLNALKKFQSHSEIISQKNSASEQVIKKIIDLWKPIIDFMDDPADVMDIQNEKKLNILISIFSSEIQKLNLPPAVVISLEKTLEHKRKLVQKMNEEVMICLFSDKDSSEAIASLVENYLKEFKSVPILKDLV